MPQEILWAGNVTGGHTGFVFSELGGGEVSGRQLSDILAATFLHRGVHYHPATQP